nr:putative per os infectivity factor PIF3 [Microplitis mediator]
MTYIVCSMFIVSIIFMCLYQLQQINASETNKKSLKLFSGLNIDAFKIQNRKIDDCNLERQYCFSKNDCFNRCKRSKFGEFDCIVGKCKMIVNYKNLDDIDKCDLKEGMAPFLVGIPELATVVPLCKSVDPGIVYKDKKTGEIKNRMCEDGNISKEINYVTAWPDAHQCGCDGGKVLIVIPRTETVRQHVKCVDANHAWLYEENKLLYSDKLTETTSKILEQDNQLIPSKEYWEDYKKAIEQDK